MEIWKDVVGYEGKYQVSNLGRVKSLNYNRTGKEQILKTQTNRYGYLYVCLGSNHNKVRIHRLVAEAFIPNPYNLPEVNHKDLNRANNVVDNLEWATREYNIDYSHSTPVEQLTMEGTVVKNWKSIREADRHGFVRSAVWECCKGKRPHYKGFLWRYAS